MWYTEIGNMGDIALSSRIRLARNIDQIPFGLKMTEEDRHTIIDKCKAALPELKYIDLSSMKGVERAALSESHLISPEMASNSATSGILTNDTCDLCIMLCEEDHIRIQAMTAGFDLLTAFQTANEIDDKLEDGCDIAFDAVLGYLTCCPTNTGTGLRASVMMHLPSLTESNNMNNIIRSLSKIGITVRGFYGEGSQSSGNIYQISNQTTLGVTEAETLEKLTQIVTDLINKERELGQKIYEQNKFATQDRVLRALGLLRSARLLASDEAMNLVSDVRRGINLGIIKDVDLKTLNTVWYKTLPASITKAYNTVNATERDLKRAELFNSAL